MNYKNEKWKYLAQLAYLESNSIDYDEDSEGNLIEYKDILNKLIEKEKWDIIFKYFNINGYKITLEQTREECLNFVRRSVNCRNSLQFVIKQDDEIVLEAIKKNIYNIMHVRIPLKKATLVEIDLMHGERIDLEISFRFHYMILMEEAIE